MAGRLLCRASASGDVAAGKAAGGWPGAVPLAPAEALVEARAAAAGGAASAAGGGLARGVILILPAKSPVPKQAAMAGRPLCHASASRDVAAGKAAGGWPCAFPLAPAEALVEA